MGNDDTRRPGFDYWVSVKGQGTYIDPELNEDGKVAKVPGYVTDIFNDRAVALPQAPATRSPSSSTIAHKAVHPDLIQFADGRISDPTAGTFLPAERHQDLYADQPVPRRPNVADRLDGKPALQRPIAGLPPLGPATGTSDETVRNRLRVLMAVDEGVGQIFEALEQTGKLDDTLVIFTSDHGYFYGEHGLSVERRLAYEEGDPHPPADALSAADPARAPMLDPLVLEPRPRPDAARARRRSASPRASTAARSSPLLAGRAVDRPRTSFLIEYFSDDIVFPRLRQMGYQAVRTERWKYIHYTELDGMDELYDLESDPFEVRNLINEPSARARLEEMRGAPSPARRVFVGCGGRTGSRKPSALPPPNTRSVPCARNLHSRWIRRVSSTGPA